MFKGSTYCLTRKRNKIMRIDYLTFLLGKFLHLKNQYLRKILIPICYYLIALMNSQKEFDD